MGTNLDWKKIDENTWRAKYGSGWFEVEWQHGTEWASSFCHEGGEETLGHGFDHFGARDICQRAANVCGYATRQKCCSVNIDDHPHLVSVTVWQDGEMIYKQGEKEEGND